MTTWQPKKGELKAGETIIAPYPRKMEAIAMRRLLRQQGVVAELRRVQGERESRWCLIVKKDEE